MTSPKFVLIPVEVFDCMIDSLEDGIHVANRVASDDSNVRTSYPYVCGYSESCLKGIYKTLMEFKND